MLLANVSVVLFVVVLAAFSAFSPKNGTTKVGQNHHGDTAKKQFEQLEKKASSSTIDLNFNLFFNVFNY